MRIVKRGLGVTIVCLLSHLLAPSGIATAQSAEDRYLAARDVAIERFAADRVPNIGKADLDAESKVRAELDGLIRDVIGPVTLAGFEAGRLNLTTLFGGDIDFGKLDGLAFEADGGDTKVVVTTPDLLTAWRQARWQDPADRLAADNARNTDMFYLRAMGSDAAILRYADIAPGFPETYAILAARTQDMPPLEADEVFVTAVRGDRVFVASARVEPIAVADCTGPRQAAEAKLAEIERTEIKPGPRNSAALEKVIRMRDRIESEFRRCFAQAAPNQPGFAAAVRRVSDLIGLLPAK